MLMPDVNVLVGAFRTDSEHHEDVKGWLESSVKSAETVGLSDAVLTGFVRVVTHRRIFKVPTPLDMALRQIETLRKAPGVLRVTPGGWYVDIFARLCRGADARGNLVADAAHAATAMEAGATWITLDRDFARFAGLKWDTPLGTIGR
ncbi:type II toxin-antitoxin system VapC family toxin [Arthrobacter castelli]|uniref:type II toxin-antitoxin system VapC family toxin n=1 Tax=Arthrobacter castelli TaxID=271431 RepID=UPI0003FC0560|nr:type II toxin-antitoxin system VapC family toxin [Arthrobacter castelli]